MKVLLKKDVEKLGKEGEIKEVKPGFARHFLIPKGLAQFSTPDIEAKIAKEKEEKEKEKIGEKEKLEQIAKKLNGAKIEIVAKTGKGKKLFGSITSDQIKEKISEQFQIELGKEANFTPKSIKEIGQKEVTLKLGLGIFAKLNISVKSQE